MYNKIATIDINIIFAIWLDIKYTHLQKIITQKSFEVTTKVRENEWYANESSIDIAYPGHTPVSIRIEHGNLWIKVVYALQGTRLRIHTFGIPYVSYESYVVTVEVFYTLVYRNAET